MTAKTQAELLAAADDRVLEAEQTGDDQRLAQALAARAVVWRGIAAGHRAGSQQHTAATLSVLRDEVDAERARRRAEP